jgi:hypothetical protein
MHIIALGYPSNPTYTDKKAAKEFYESLQFLIPCPICREHYSKYLQEQAISPFLDRRQDLFRWTVDIHNKVNQSLKKPRVSEQEAIAFYGRLGNRGRSPVLTPDDFAEADLKAIIQGFALGIGVAGAAFASFWWISKGES